MKNILLYLLLFSSLLSFSQSEIWGVNRFSGMKNGGFLYTIDSATNKLIIQHRFIDDNYYPETVVIPRNIENTGNWIGVDSKYFIKFNEISRTVQQKKFDGLVYGSFVKVSDSVWYILEENGLMKLNPISMDYRKMEGYKPLTFIPDNGLSLWGENNLVWQQVNENRNGYICSFNIQTEEVSLVYDLGSFQEATYAPVGKLLPYNGRYYGLTYQRKDGVKYLLIYSYKFETNDFREEYRVESKKINRNTVNGLVLADNNKFYSIAPINPKENNSIVFSFDPQTNKLDSLAIFSNEIGIDPNGPFAMHDNIIFGSCKKGGSFNSGSIFKYDINQNGLDTLFCFDNSSSLFIERAVTTTNDGRVIGAEYTATDHRARQIYQYNPSTSIKKTLIEFDFLTNQKGGTFPNSIVQLDNGMIIGTTSYGGEIIPNNKDKSFNTMGVIYQFNPVTKDFKPLINSASEAYNPYFSDIYKLSDNRIFGVIRGMSTNWTAGKFIFDPSTNQFDTLQSFPWERFTHKIIMESDSIIYTIRGNYFGLPPHSIIKYNIFTDEFVEIKNYDIDISISNFVEYNEDNILFLSTKKYADGIDSVFLNKLNKSSGSIITLIDLNRYSKNSGNINFIFTIAPNNSLIGDYREQILDDVSTSNSYELSQVLLNLDDFTLKILSGPELNDYVGWDWLAHSYIRTYKNDGSIFAVNEEDYYNDGGAFKLVDIANSSVSVLEIMEEPTVRRSTPDEEVRQRLKKFKKMDFNIHWTGEKNHDWYIPENWLGGIVPDTNSLVCIDASTPYHLIIDSLVIAKQMVVMREAKVSIEKTGVLNLSKTLVNHGNFEIRGDKTQKGSLICQEALINKGETKYHYTTDSTFIQSIASPVESVGFRESVYYQISEYSSGELFWNPVSYYPFIPNSTIAYLFDSDLKDIEFNGRFNYGDYDLIIPRSSDSEFYPLPNPYPSSLDWRNLNLSNIPAKALYKFNAVDSSYSAYVDGLGDASPLIQPLDVFWVYGNGGDEIPLDNNDRIHAIDFKDDSTPERNELIIRVQGKDGSNRTHISFNSKATAEYDEDLDALKNSFLSIAPPQVFTFGGEEKLAINQLPDTALMDLAIQARKDGTYTLTIDKSQGFDFVVLEDLIWKKRIDLLQQDYSFDYFTSDGDYPFKLYFKPWALEPVNESDIEIYYYPESIVVRSRKQIEYAQIIFYDLAGRVALQIDAEDFHHFEKPISLPVGHYIVQVRTGDLVVNRKVLVRR